MIDNPLILAAAVPRRIARWSGAVVLLAGVLVLIGWGFDFPALTGVAGSTTMKANTALCFVLCGAALWLLQMPGRHSARAARICTLIVGGIALLTLVEYATGWNPGIDELLVRDTGSTPGIFHRGRMGSNSALCFALVAAGLWLMSRPTGNTRRPLILAWLGAVVVAIGLFAVLDYFTGFTLGYSWWRFTGMAIHTAVVFLLIAIALLAFSWRETGARWLIEPWSTAGFTAGLALLVAVAAISHRSTENLVDAVHRVKHTHEVLAKISEIQSSLEEHHSAVRGFALTGNESFLSLSQHATPEVSKRVRELRELTSDNASHQRQIAILETEIEERVQLVRAFIELRRSRGLDEAAAQVAVVKGKPMNVIRARLDGMAAEESNLLQARAAKSKAVTDRTFALLPVGTVLSLVLLISGLLRLNRMMVARQRETDALRKSQELLALAIGAGRLGVWDWDLATATMVWDERCKAVAGLPRDAEMTYEVALGTIHPDDRARLVAAVTHALQTKADTNVEYRTVWPDGTVRWVQSRGRSYEDAGGKLVRGTGTLMDITERKQVEEVLRESEAGERARREELEVLMDAIPVAVFIAHDAACQRMTGNRITNELLRLPAGHNASRSAEEAERPDFAVWSGGRLLSPEELPMQRAAATGQVVSGAEFEIVFPDGAKHELLGSALPLFDSSGAVRGAVGAFLDITARKGAEAALRESQSRLRIAADVARMAYVEVDLVSGRAQSSENFAAVMGYAGSPGGIADLAEGSALWLAHIVPEDRAHYATAYQKFLEGHFPEKVEYRSVGDDGIERWIESTTTGDFGSDGTLLRAFNINIDITERKRAEALLRTNAALFSALIEQAPMGVYVVDAHFRIQQVNTQAMPIFEHVRPVIGRDFDEVLEIVWGPEVGGRCAAIFRHTLKTGEGYVSATFSERRQDTGEEQAYEWETRRVTLPDGQHGVAAYFHEVTERMRAERALRASEERTSLATTATGVGIWEWNVLTHTIHWDAQMFRIYGTPSTSDGVVPYTTWSEAVLPEDLAQQETALRGMKLQGDQGSREFRIRRADDRTLRYVRSVETVRTNAHGQVEWVVGTNLDITERKRTEMNVALLASLTEDLVRLTSVDGIMQTVGAKIGGYLDLSCCGFAEVNEAADQVVVTHEWRRDDAHSILGGYRLNEFLTEDFQKAGHRGELFVVRDINTDPRTDARRYAALGINAFLCVPLLQDGRWRFLLSIYRREPYDWREDEIEVMRELTRRVRTRIDGIRADEAVRESEARFRAIADNIPQLAWMADGDGHFRWFNRAWLVYTGTRLEDNLGAGWKAVCHPDFVDVVAEKLERHLREGRDWEHTFRLRGKDGSYRWFLSRMNAIRDESGKVVRFFGTNTDVTESLEAQIQLAKAHDTIARRAEELETTVAERTGKLRETIEELEGYSYCISHDMRAPLRAMQSFAQILEEECGDQISQQGLEYIRRIVTAADRMDALIRDILTYSKIVRSELPLANVDLAALLTGILEDYPQFHANGAEISIVHPLPHVLGNAAALTQCLSNLVGNAVKFVAAGVKPKVKIWAEVRGPRVCLFVRDNGIGIEPEMHDKIFSIFYRTSRDYEGTGIGLAIVSRAAQRMGGQISLVSEPEKGSTFQLELNGVVQG